jgi:WD40 repeat protein
MGVVFQGRSPAGDAVAIKLLTGRRAEAQERFAREQRLAASLGEAEGFVPILDTGESPEGAYLVMPVVPGGTLRLRLAGGPLPFESVVEIGVALAQAAGHAHARGIVHRDLKPENVLFTADGRPLLADLGVAKHFSRDAPGASQSVALSKTGDFRGTVGYMAPEQVRDSKGVDARADVYALGAILYECLAGVPAFSADSVGELLDHVSSGVEPPDLNSLCPEAPGWLIRVVQRALAHDPARRYPDGAALSEALAGRAEEGPAGPWPKLIGAAAGLALVALSAWAGQTMPRAKRSAGAGGDDVAPLVSKQAPAPAPASGSVEADGPVQEVFGAPNLPAECAGFRQTRVARLVGVWGTYRAALPGFTRVLRTLPDGRMLAGADADVALVAGATGRVERLFRGHTKLVNDLAPLPAGRRFASASNDRTIKVWDLAAGEAAQTLSGHEAEVSCLAAFPDGSALVSGSQLPDGRGELRIWDLESGEVRRRLVVAGFPFQVRVLPGDRVLATTVRLDGKANLEGSRPGLELWDARGGERLGRLPLGTLQPFGLAVDPAGRWCATGTAEGSVRVFDLEAWEEARAWTVDRVATIDASPDGRELLVGGGDDLERFEVSSGRRLGRLPKPSQGLLAACYTPDGARVISGGRDQTLRAWDLDGRSLWPREGHSGPILALAWSQDGRDLWTASGHSLRIRRVADGSLRSRHDLPPHGDEEEPISMSGAVFAPEGPAAFATRGAALFPLFGEAWAARDGRAVQLPLAPFRLASSGDGARLLLCDPRGALASVTPDGLRVVGRAARRIAALAINESGRLALAAAGRDLELWDLDGNRRVQALRSPGHMTALAFAPGDERALAGEHGGAIQVWNLVGGNALGRLGGHSAPVVHVAPHPDGVLAASASEDGTVRLWDLEQAVEVDRIDLTSSLDAPRRVAFSPDGRGLAVGTERGLVLRFVLSD